MKNPSWKDKLILIAEDDGEFAIVLNPPKSSTVILSKGDSLILLAEN